MANWIANFEELKALSQNEQSELLKRSNLITVPANTVVFGPGKVPEHLSLIVKGSVRVQQVSENGREIVLYRINGGESCVLTTACLLAREAYNAEGVTETEVTAVTIPVSVFDAFVVRSSVFRQFVFSEYASRFTDLLNVIEDVAFQRVDIRLAQRLICLSVEANNVKTTHQLLATDLGTAREVVSRLLNEFQRRGWISRSRGLITIIKRERLSRLAENHT